MLPTRKLHLAKRVALQHVRNIFSKTGKWNKELDRDTRKEIEDYWKTRLVDQHLKSKAKDAGKDKFYVLSMFPYPSGNLHMGHVRVYAISDTMARFHRLQGKAVIHPMGWDAFGLPAENAAIERGEAPDKWTYKNIATMKKQLEDMACSFDWDREYSTCSPEYYRWTQHLFLKMYDAGLVYHREGSVNWDPLDQTVLADEQIDENGCSWRSGAKVEKKYLKQWYIRTQAYFQSLLDGLEEVDPELWRDVVALQKGWIGKLDGLRMELTLTNKGEELETPMAVFTRNPECLHGASHILVSEEHRLNNPEYYKEPRTGSENEDIELTVHAISPLSQQPLPIYVSRTHDFGMHLDQHLAIPSVREEDRDFAVKHGLGVTEVLSQDGDTLVNSDKLTGMQLPEAFKAVVQHLQETGCTCHVSSENGRDWLISRQRYWGTPIPMMHCPKYGTMPVPYEDLPVVLPQVSNLKGKGASPLATAHDWLKVKCPRCDCDSYAVRETDTMDTFVDSSWYYLRYLDPHNTQELCSREAAHAGMPVDLYIGGKEHAVMHLYYARFFHHFLHSQGLTPTREPFVSLLTQGMVMGQSFKVKDTGKYLRPEEVTLGKSAKDTPVETATGAEVSMQWEKMSKSKYNGVNPQAILSTYGTDTTRLCILANVAPKSERHWSLDVFKGVERWQNRVWNLVGDFMSQRLEVTSEERTAPDLMPQTIEELSDLRNFYVKEVTPHIRDTFLLNAAISDLQTFSVQLKKFPTGVVAHSAAYERALCDYVIMLAPFAPMFASELWTGLVSVSHLCDHYDWTSSVLEQQWPVVDPDYRPSLKVKVKSLDVLQIKLPYTLDQLENLTKEEACQLVRDHPLFDLLSQLAHIEKPVLTVIPGLKATILYERKEWNKTTKQVYKQIQKLVEQEKSH